MSGEKLGYISSAGLRVVLLMRKILLKEDREMVVCSLDSNVREIFIISGFDRIMDVYSDVEHAVEALTGAD